MPSLDGLRGVAILAVLVYHFGGHFPHLMALLPGPAKIPVMLGQSGVDLFFVLSGFLITGILIDTRTTANRWRNFLARRSLRIFPLYFLTIAIVYLLFPAFFHTEHCAEYQLWAWLYAVNIGHSFGWSPNFGHFWSLAVEEQFYLVWPFFVWACATRHRLIVLCLATMGLAWGTRLFFMNYDPFPAPFTLCRIDALAAGGLLATVARTSTNHKAWVKYGAWVLGFTSVALAPLYLIGSGSGAGWQQVIKFGCFAVIYAAILAIAIGSSEDSFVTRFLRNTVLRWFGKYSYALYIFHPFVLVALDERLPAGGIMQDAVRCVAALALTVAMALVSWKLFEKPILAMKHRFEPDYESSDYVAASEGMRHRNA